MLRSRNALVTHLVALMVALFGVMVVASCKKDDPIDPDTTPPAPETSISFTCKDSLGIQGVFVGIAIQQNDCNAGIFLRTGDTDALGKIKFSSLSPATYCYEAARTVTGGVVKRTGTVDLQQDEEAKVTVTF